MYFRLASNSQSCFSFQSAGITGTHHHTWLFSLILFHPQRKISKIWQNCKTILLKVGNNGTGDREVGLSPGSSSKLKTQTSYPCKSRRLSLPGLCTPALPQDPPPCPPLSLVVSLFLLKFLWLLSLENFSPYFIPVFPSFIFGTRELSVSHSTAHFPKQRS
jgi:hypothetical protein